MTKINLTRGIPGSGKTTFAIKWVAADPEHRARVNRDDLRETMFPGTKHPYGKDKEDAVTEAQNAMVKSLLSKGFEVICDDTNLRAQNVKRFFGLADEVEFIDFPIDLQEAITRDVERMTAGKRWVGAEVITDFYNRFTPKGKFPKVPERPEVLAGFAQYAHTPGLPSAIIVDIDGTLADLSHRSPYSADDAAYRKDGLHKHVADIVSQYSWKPVSVIVMSGRDSKFRPVTVEWMRDHGIHYDEFYMRPEGDTRNDAIVKNELFEQHVAGRFNIDFVLDDRTRVVDMWRAKGLKCLQVAPGDF